MQPPKTSTAGSIRLLISAGFGMMLLMILAITLYSLNHMAQVNDRMDHIVNTKNEKIDHISTLRNIARERSLLLYQITSLRDPFEIDDRLQQMSKLAQQFLIIREELFNMPLTDREEELIDQALEQAYHSTAVQRELIEKVKAGDFEAAKRILDERSIPVQNTLIALYEAALDYEHQEAKREAKVAEQRFAEVTRTSTVIGGIILLLGLAISFYVIRHSISAETALKQLNEDLEDRVKQRTQDLESANLQLQSTIAELRDTQEHLIQAEKMASLGNLVSGVAHEVNTPLGVCITSASSLQDQTEQLESALADGEMKRSDLSQYLSNSAQIAQLLLTNLQRSAELVQNFKQVAADQYQDDWREINVKDYVEESLKSLTPRLDQTDISVTADCDSDITLYSSPGAIYQIIHHLVLNSLVHGFDTESLSHALKSQPNERIEIRCREKDGRLLLEYADNGRGIESHLLDKVFEPFFTTRRGQGNTGLGLSILYNLITNTLKGSMQVESKEGDGCHFTIELPLRQQPQSAS